MSFSPSERRESRGGSFLDPAARLRSAYEGNEGVTHLSRDMGFRVARTIRRDGRPAPTP